MVFFLEVVSIFFFPIRKKDCYPLLQEAGINDMNFFLSDGCLSRSFREIES